MRRAGADPFEFAGDHRGVLCVHGFTGSPFEMRFLGEKLAARGFTVVGPALAGHDGADPAALDRTTWRDWLGTAEGELARLRARCRSVAVVGMSLGGLLALHLARHRGAELAAIASLGAPLWLPRWVELAVPLVAAAARVARRLALVPKLGGGSDVRDPDMRRKNPALKVFPVHALGSLLDFTRVVRAEVAGVTVPTFVAHGRHDHTAPPACAAELVRRLGARDVKSVMLERSYHVVTIDVERDLLAEELGRFLAERM